MGNNLTVAMYHYVRPIAKSRYPEIKGLEYDYFVQQIDFMRRNYNFVSCDDVRAALAGKAELPEKAMLLTFDDGYLDHFAYVFPLLARYGIPGFFSMPGKILAERKLLDVNKVHFVLASADAGALVAYIRERLDSFRKDFSFPTFDELYAKYAVANRFDPAEVIFVKRALQTALPEQVRNTLTEELFRKYIPVSEDSFVNELYMTLDQVKVMVKYRMEFGLHGYDHCWLGNLTPEAMRKDIDMALAFFDGILPKRGWVMCFPYGSSNRDTIEYVKSRGAGFGFSTEVRVAKPETDDPYTLPRLDTNDFPPKSERYKDIK